MIHPHPNRFQRWYFTWAQPHYERMEPALRAEVQRLDLLLYSQRGLWVWGLVAAGFAASAGMLNWLGVPVWVALLLAALLWVLLPLGALSAWLQPAAFTPKRMARIAVISGVSCYAGVVAGRSALLLMNGQFDLAALAHALLPVTRNGLWGGLQLGSLLGIPLLLLLSGVATVRRRARARELAEAQAQRQTAEGRLRTLQAQIQPHFLFNTLAALQHWVDSGDARAGGLLRSLTAFLRGATDLLDRPRVALAEEAACVAHYLAVQQARLGPRLASSIDIAPDCARVALPPGLVLTLVENAVQHGVAPAVGGGAVHVRAWREPLAVCISVHDTGCGLPAGGAVPGVGLRNSRERLVAAFGPTAVLALMPAASGGTEARIGIPASALVDMPASLAAQAPQPPPPPAAQPPGARA